MGGIGSSAGQSAGTPAGRAAVVGVAAAVVGVAAVSGVAAGVALLEGAGGAVAGALELGATVWALDGVDVFAVTDTDGTSAALGGAAFDWDPVDTPADLLPVGEPPMTTVMPSAAGDGVSPAAGTRGPLALSRGTSVEWLETTTWSSMVCT